MNGPQTRGYDQIIVVCAVLSALVLKGSPSAENSGRYIELPTRR